MTLFYDSIQGNAFVNKEMPYVQLQKFHFFKKKVLYMKHCDEGVFSPSLLK